MFVESFGDDALVDGAYDLLFDLTVFEDEKSWNASNVETRACRAIGVDIQFADFHTAFVFLCNCVNGWSYRAARRTPSRPKIHKYRCAGLHNFRFEVVVRNLNRVCAHESSEKNFTLTRQSSQA